MFTVLQGDKEAVDALLTHPDVAAVSFVGSTPIARYVYETGTAHGKRVQALGGAKNHMVVLPDADLDLAADAAVSAAYGAAGERCMAVSVTVAVGDVGDRLVEAIASRLPKVRVGDGADPDSEMGPLITAAHRDRVAGYIDAGAASGASVVVDGRQGDLPPGGFFLGTTLLDRVTPQMSVYTDEIFGPVLSVVRVDTYDEAVSLINANQYANGVAIFTRDGGAARRFQFEVEVGHGRHQRADPGAGGVLLLRRLEELAVRRHAHVRAGGRQLLHPWQGGHLALARPGDVVGRPGLPADPLSPAHGFRRPSLADRRDWTVQTDKSSLYVVGEITEQAARAASELRVLVGRLPRRLREVADAGDLSPSQVSVLSLLDKGGGASASDLAALERVRPQSMATTLAALDQQRLIRRDPDPEDGRRQLVSLTPAGREVVQGTRQAREEWLARSLQDRYTEAERRTILEALALLGRLTGR